jgi:hypothetical protein
VADLPGTAPVPGVLVDELPLYVLEDERETRHRLRQLGTAVRGQWRTWAASAPAGGWWPAAQQQPLVPSRMPVMLVITRVIDLAPQLTMAALEDWWQEADGQLSLSIGPDLLEVGRPLRTQASSACLMRVRTRLHRPSRWSHSQRLDMEVVSWSATRTELDLRPGGPGRRTHHFFAVGHELLGEIGREVAARAAALAGPTPAPSACPP